MKRLSAPKFWRMARKQACFAPTPRGSHPKRMSIPLLVLLRDVLGYARSAREARQILNSGAVRVDGAVRRDSRHGAGLMDVLSVGGKSYALMPGGHGITLRDAAPGRKLLQVRGKRLVKQGRLQINCHDGRNILAAQQCKVGDTLLFDIAGGKIEKVLRFAKGAEAIVIDGKNSGVVGTVEELIKRPGSQPNEVVLAISSGKITVPQKYVFVTGEAK